MDDMMYAINAYPNGTYLKILWDTPPLILDGVIDTIYETDNEVDGVDEYSDKYMEFYACAFQIKRVYENQTGTNYQKNMLIEISKANPPMVIFDENGQTIWTRKQ